jgi:MFS family permease
MEWCGDCLVRQACDEARDVMAALLREPARPAVIREHPLAPWFAVAAVCFGAFMGQLDASVVTVAFPALQRQFGAGLAAVQWVSLGYLLVLTALLVPAGRWSDRVGRKLMYLYGFVLFAAASAGCGLAPSLGLLIGLRLVQAAGAALLQANSVALVVTSVPAGTRRAALGVQAAAQAVGLACGPVTGGLLVAAGGWRWIFFLNVPVGLLAVAAGVYLLPRTRGTAGRRAGDAGGMVLLAATATAGMLVVSALSGLGPPAWVTLAFAVVAAAAGTALLRHERRTAAPLLDLRALAASGSGTALFGALCAYLVLFGPLVLFPQLVSAAGGSAASAGLLLTALPVGFGLAAVGADRLLPARWPNRFRCLIGGAVAAVCAAALAVPAPDAVSVVLLGFLGAGLGLYTPANNAEIMAAVPARDAASAGGMVNMTRGVGTALGVAVVTLGLHAGALARSADAGRALALAALAVVALAGTWAGQRGARTAPGVTGPGSGGPASRGLGSGEVGSGGSGAGGLGSGGLGSGGRATPGGGPR